MADRKVQKIAPKTDEGIEEIKPFSDYLDYPNIILLGDSGAGKTYLLKQFSKMNDAQFLSARNFLDIPSSNLRRYLFIDALDESRAGRGDRSFIGEIVKKLYEVSPKQVRISCRAADWLGETDLEIFLPYFTSNGGYIILQLQPLSQEEQHTILTVNGISNPAYFIEEATARGLESFLTNPQTLIMLAEIIHKGKGIGWPNTKKELFEKATNILLCEHNSNHSYSKSGEYNEEELQEIGGAICAAQLISNIDEISLNKNPPNYRDFSSICQDTDKVLAVLSRRIFSAVDKFQKVNTVHRTIAEYLGALWLSKQINEGFPIGLVQSLIGVDGYPTTELRGMHAWLAAFLRDDKNTNLIINADPFGVLVYGDVASMSLSARKKLVKALENLSVINPLFRAENWSLAGIGALSGKDMVEPFRKILKSEEASFHLRTLILDILVAGTPVFELQEDLLKIIFKGDASYSEKKRALYAIIKMGDSAKGKLAEIYPKILGEDAKAIQLRAEILAQIYPAHLTLYDVVTLLQDAYSCNERISTSAFNLLHSRILLEHIESILNNLKFNKQEYPPDKNYDNSFIVFHVFDMILLSLITAKKHQISGKKLWEWLLLRFNAIAPNQFGGACFKETLSQNKVLLQSVTEAALDSIVIDGNETFFIYYEFFRIILCCVNELELLEIISKRIFDKKDDDAKFNFFYKTSLELFFRNEPYSIFIFEQLYDFAEDYPSLVEIRTQCCKCDINSISHENFKISAQCEQNEMEKKENILKKFEQDKDLILSGTNCGWLANIADIYFDDLDEKNKLLSPCERLTQAFGEEKAKIAISGLIACLQSNNIPSLETIIQSVIKNRFPCWWDAILAGLNEQWVRNVDLNYFSEALLTTAIAIDIVRHYRISFGWKVAILEQRPEFVYDIYLVIIHTKLEHRIPCYELLHELLENSVFCHFRINTVLQILKRHPNSLKNDLEKLLTFAISNDLIRKELLDIFAEVFSEQTNLTNEARGLWIVVAYLIEPEKYKIQLENLLESNSNMIWYLRDINVQALNLRLAPAQIGEIICIFVKHFPVYSIQNGACFGDTNEWDASNFISKLINQLSTNESVAAGEVLSCLLKNNFSEGYSSLIKNAILNQKAKNRALRYKRLSWDETITALSNRKPATAQALYELTKHHLRDICRSMATTSADIYKNFWNEDNHGKIKSPKCEESCRNTILMLLKDSLHNDIFVQSEVQMANGRIVDILVSLPRLQIPIEIKKNCHREVWNAALEQLDKYYTLSSESDGFGIYVVIWFGDKGNRTPNPPNRYKIPRTAFEMELLLNEIIPSEKRHRLVAIVIDVSGVTS